MRNWLHKIAFYLFPYRKYLLFIAVFFFLVLIYSLTSISVVKDTYSTSTSSLVGLLWSLLLFVIVTIYHGERKLIPEKLSFMAKLKMKLINLLLFVLGSLLLILTAVSAYLTLKLFTL